MHRLLDEEPGRPCHATYLDDVTLGATDVATNWQDTLTALRRLLKAGFPISAWKLQLLRRVLHILGVVLSSSRYHIGHKALSKLFGSTLPSNMQEL